VQAMRMASTAAPTTAWRPASRRGDRRHTERRPALDRVVNPYKACPTMRPDDDSPLRIAYLTYRGKPHVGGQGVYTRHLTKALVDLGHTVEVFSGQPYPVLDERVTLHKLPSLDLWNEQYPGRFPAYWEVKSKGDLNETLAVKSVFGGHAGKLMMSSTKSMTGHLLGAAGGLEAVFCCMAMDKGVVPPTINYEEPDPELDLDYVPNVAREKSLDVVMSNGFGFGGTNGTLVFKKL